MQDFDRPGTQIASSEPTSKTEKSSDTARKGRSPPYLPICRVHSKALAYLSFLILSHDRYGVGVEKGMQRRMYAQQSAFGADVWYDGHSMQQIANLSNARMGKALSIPSFGSPLCSAMQQCWNRLRSWAICIPHIHIEDQHTFSWNSCQS